MQNAEVNHDIRWECKTFEELSSQELYEIMRLRIEVFVIEQDCIYQDADNKDQYALHLMGKQGGEVVAYLRILPSGVSYAEPSIGRVVVAASQRGQNTGRELMEQAIAYLRKELGADRIRISAQQYLLKFYGSLGFEGVSEVYLEDGIPHVEMLWQSEG